MLPWTTVRMTLCLVVQVLLALLVLRGVVSSLMPTFLIVSEDWLLGPPSDLSALFVRLLMVDWWVALGSPYLLRFLVARQFLAALQLLPLRVASLDFPMEVHAGWNLVPLLDWALDLGSLVPAWVLHPLRCRLYLSIF